MKGRKLALLSGLGMAGLALIGVGAGATFTDSVHGQQVITAGTLSMTVQGPAGSSTDGKTVTLQDLGPQQSTFTTGEQKIVTTNTGNIKASAILLSASDQNNGAPNSLALKNALQVKIYSWSAPNEGGSKVLVYQGSLVNFEANSISIVGDVPAGSTDPFTVEFSASNLGNEAQGGVVVPKITVDYQG